MEFINIQDDASILAINDFRAFQYWKDTSYKSTKLYFKDVGHSQAISQAFTGNARCIQELKVSTFIMLKLAEMVRNRTKTQNFKVENL